MNLAARAHFGHFALDHIPFEEVWTDDSGEEAIAFVARLGSQRTHELHLKIYFLSLRGPCQQEGQTY
jgi:hypothetical protein